MAYGGRLSEAPGGPTGLLHLPYLRGSGPPSKDPTVKGSLFGIDERLSVSTWLKGVIEGLCCESRRILDGMAVPEAASVTVIGGGVNNPYWLQVKADVMGRVLIVPRAAEAVAQGAAMLAGVAAGLYEDPREGASVMSPPAVTITPDPRLSRGYDDWYRNAYLKAWQTNRDVQKALGEFASRSTEPKAASPGS